MPGTDSVLTFTDDADVGSDVPQRFTEDRLRRLVDRSATVFVLLVTGWMFLKPLRDAGHIMGYAQDDFYYYLTVARNFAKGAGSTFDGSTLTNGYHPLYFLFLVLVTRISSSLPAVFRALWVLDVCSALSVFLLVRRLLARRYPSVWLQNACAVGIMYLCCFRLFSQMEVTLTLPLGFLFLLLVERGPERNSARRWFAIGLVSAAMILSRLDSSILLLLCAATALGGERYRRTLTIGKVEAFVGGCAPPILIYLLVNEHFFHRLLPVSGAAKQMRTAHHHFWHAIRVSTSPEAAMMFGLALVALCALPYFWARLSMGERVVCLSCLLFPFVHWATSLWISDWALWPWYKYSLPFAMMAVLLLAGIQLSTWSFPSQFRVRMEIAALGVAALALLSQRYRLDICMGWVGDGAELVRRFGETHPGRYAMGDRAGMPGYIDGQPTVQLEGLVMDQAFLDHIRREEPLRSVLRTYGVDYYVGFDWKEKTDWPAKDGCFKAREPYQAGKDSPAMLGMFCEPPAAQLIVGDGRVVIYDVRAKR